MNLYIRFFNDETLVRTAEEAMAFLQQVTNDELDPTLYNQLADYQNSPMPYPKRFKVRARTYFIVIKTPAATMEEFKERGAQMQAAQHKNAEIDDLGQITAAQPKANEVRRNMPYDAYQPGWYEISMTFKRVVLNEAKGKNEYIDTTFAARLKAHSTKEAYDKVCDYLLHREDIDNRSQMPSIKGKNFTAVFLGMQEVGA